MIEKHVICGVALSMIGLVLASLSLPPVAYPQTITVGFGTFTTTMTYGVEYRENPNLPTIHIIGQILLVVGVTEFVYGLITKKDKNVPAHPQQ